MGDSSLSESSSKVLIASTQLVFLDKCAVCSEPASKKCGGCSLTFYCGPNHQRLDWPRHKMDCKLYEMVQQEGGENLCLVAVKLIPADTIIVSEYPLVIFEDSIHQEEESLVKLLEVSEACPVKCFGCETGWITGGDAGREDLRCSKCGLPVCSLQCSETVKTLQKHLEGDCKILQDIGKMETRSGTDIAKIPGDLRILRVLYREKMKGTPVSLKTKGGSVTWSPLLKQAKGLPSSGKDVDIPSRFPLSLAAIGGNAEGMEVIRLLNTLLMEYSLPVDSHNKRKRALFEKHCYLAHSCAPNTEWWLDTSGYHLKLQIRVIKPILPGENLTIFRSFDSTLIYNPTVSRRQKLQKQALPLLPCECERCSDPTELGTCLSGIRCTVCKDISATLTCNYYFPSNPLDKRPSWSCSNKNCRSTKTFEQILVITMKAEKELEQIWKAAVVVSTGCGSSCEPVITKLQNFIVKHQRKILNPNHYLILIARSRINRVVSHFLGVGDKLFLCVVTNQPRAYDYCAYKVEHLQLYLSFMNKLCDSGMSRIGAKLRYELVFSEAGLLFRDFQEERMGGASFFRRLHGIMENLGKCQKGLMYYQDCKHLVETVKHFGQVLVKLFGQDFLSSYRLKLLQSSTMEEGALRGVVKEAIERWSEACENIGLKKLYMNPIMSMGVGASGASNENIIMKEDLHAILVDVPQRK